MRISHWKRTTEDYRLYTIETMKKKRMSAKADFVTRLRETIETHKNRRGRLTLKKFGDSDELNGSLKKEFTPNENGLNTKSPSNNTSSEAPSTLDYKSLTAQCVDVCQNLERACCGEEVVAECDSNHTVSVAPGAISSTLVDSQQPPVACSTNEINMSASINSNFIDQSRKRPLKRPSLFKSTISRKKQRMQTTANNKPSNCLKKPEEAIEEAEQTSLLAADSREKADGNNAQFEENESNKFSANGGPLEIPFIMVKSSFESRHRRYKCVFCSQVLDKISQYEDHWLSHITGKCSSQMQWKFQISSNCMPEAGFEFAKNDGIGNCKRSSSILEETKSRAVNSNLTNGERLHNFSKSSEITGPLKHNNSSKIFENTVDVGDFASQRPLSKIETLQESGTASTERRSGDENELSMTKDKFHGAEKQFVPVLNRYDTESSLNLIEDVRNRKHNNNTKKVNSLVLDFEKGFSDVHNFRSMSERNRQKNCVQNKSKLSMKNPCSTEIEVLSIGSNVQERELRQKRAEFQEQEIVPKKASLAELMARSSRNSCDDICHESKKDAVTIQIIDPAELKSKVDEVLSELVIHEEEEDSSDYSMPDDHEVVPIENEVQREGEVVILQYEEERGISNDAESRTVGQLISFANNLNEKIKEKQEPGNNTLTDSQLAINETNGDTVDEPSSSNSGTHNPKKIWTNNSSPLTCTVCNKKLKTKETLRHHNTNQHKNVKIGGFPCEVCSKIYDKKLSLKEHMRRCHNPNPEVSRCEMCGNIFSRPEYLKQHMQCVHSYMIKYSCHFCHQAFKTKFIYDRHNNRFHKDLDRFKHKCSHCPWATNILSRYQQHIGRHIKKEKA